MIMRIYFLSSPTIPKILRSTLFFYSLGLHSFACRSMMPWLGTWQLWLSAQSMLILQCHFQNQVWQCWFWRSMMRDKTFGFSWSHLIGTFGWQLVQLSSSQASSFGFSNTAQTRSSGALQRTKSAWLSGFPSQHSYLLIVHSLTLITCRVFRLYTYHIIIFHNSISRPTTLTVPVIYVLHSI